LKWYVYVLRSIPTGRHYIGMTSDVLKRLHEHNTKTGRWTSSFKPWEILGAAESETRGTAMKREAFLKSRAGIAERQQWFEQLERDFKPGQRLQFSTLL
jgi:putative endonuclease